MKSFFVILIAVFSLTLTNIGHTSEGPVELTEAKIDLGDLGDLTSWSRAFELVRTQQTPKLVKVFVDYHYLVSCSEYCRDGFERDFHNHRCRERCDRDPRPRIRYSGETVKLDFKKAKSLEEGETEFLTLVVRGRLAPSIDIESPYDYRVKTGFWNRSTFKFVAE